MYDAEVRYMSTCTIKLHVVLIQNVHVPPTTCTCNESLITHMV